jgi:hypothetical protein
VEINHAHYLKTREAHQAARRRASLKVRGRNRAIVMEAARDGCVECGEKDFRVLEFDHVRGVKTADISKMISHSEERLRAELTLCEVRCANCHRRKTAERAGWYRNWTVGVEAFVPSDGSSTRSPNVDETG